MQERFIYLDGRIIPAEQAAISPFDIGLLRGYAVFDLLRTVRGKPFMLPEHLKRLRESAEQLDLVVPRTDEEITGVISELLRRNGHAEATVRLVLTGGVSLDGMTFDPATPTFYILTHELVEPPASLYQSGGKLLTEEHRREVPLAKTTNYITMLKHRTRCAEEEALDLLYHDAGRIYEAASASFYIVRGDTIMAPKTDVLWGTIGSFVLGLAEESYYVAFVDMTLEDALAADEAFLTSTTRGVVPIVSLDDQAIGDGTPGPVTKDLMARFNEAVFGS